MAIALPRQSLHIACCWTTWQLFDGNLLLPGCLFFCCFRLIGLLQLLALLVFGVVWPAVLDYCVFLLDCSWSDLAAGKAPHHITFAEQSK